jgi:predicted phage gp36 major capsid-like protein
MKEPHHLSRSRINRRDIGTFVAVAKDTAQCQIVERRRTAVLPAHDMVDLMSEGRSHFRVEAVFTAATRTAKDFRAGRFR